MILNLHVSNTDIRHDLKEEACNLALAAPTGLISHLIVQEVKDIYTAGCGYKFKCNHTRQ